MKIHNAFSIGLVVLALTGLLIAGNSNPPPLQDVISTENIRIESNYDTGALMAVIYYDNAKIYSINSWEATLGFNNTEKRLHQWFSNSTDPKKAEYSNSKGYEQLKVYFYNETGDVTRAGYILRLWDNETIDITLFAETVDNSKLGRARYALKFEEPPEKVSLHRGSVYENDGSSNHIWKKGLEMPADNEYQVYHYEKGSALLEYPDAVEVRNLFKWQLTQVYMEKRRGVYSPLRIIFSDSQAATPVQLDVMVDKFKILVNDFDGKKLPSLSTWETWLKYNGKNKRMGGWSKNNDVIWFNEYDKKKVETLEIDNSYSMRIYWQNESKDPSMLGYILTNPKNSSNLSVTIFGKVKYPERLSTAGYGIYYNTRFDTIVTPVGDVLINDGKTKHELNLESNTYVIPQLQSTNREMLLDSQDNRTVTLTSGATFSAVTNLFKFQLSYLYISDHKITDGIFEYTPLDISVSQGVEKPPQQKSSNQFQIKTSGASSDKFTQILHNNNEVMRFNAWEGLVSYYDSTRRLSATANAIKNNPNAAWFDDSDEKFVTIDKKGNTQIMRVSWRNAKKDPAEIGYIFTLPDNGEYIKVQTFVNATKPVYGVSPGFVAKDYDVYLPGGEVLKNDGYTNKLAYPKYEVLYNNGSAIIASSPSLVYMRNLFRWNVFRPVFIYPSDPLYIRYIPETDIENNDGELIIKTPDYYGNIKNFLNLNDSEDPDPVRILLLQGEISPDPVKIRGPVYNLSKGEAIKVNSSVFSGFGYKLDINFSEDRLADEGDITYTTTLDIKRHLWFLDSWYQSLYPEKTDILAHIYRNDVKKSLKVNESWTLAQGYELNVIDITREEGLFNLHKDGKPLTKEIVKKGENFTYDTQFIGRNVTIIQFRLNNTFAGKNSYVEIGNMYQYGDDPLIIKEGQEYGSFKISGITKDKITLVNTNTVQFPKGTETLMLDETIGIKTSNISNDGYVFLNKKYPGNHRLRGKNFNINSGKDITFDSSNFSGFHYDLDNNTVYEQFNASFSNDGVISKAFYTSYIHNDTTWFMGKESSFTNGVLISKIYDKHRIIIKGEYLHLENGYELLVNDVSTDSKNAIFTIYKNGKIIKTDILNSGETFTYNRKIDNKDVPVIVLHVDAIFRGMNESLVEADIIQYTDNTNKINVGDVFGLFKVSEISSGKIVLNNKKSITMPLNKDTDILEDYLKFKVEEKRYFAYPFVNQKSESLGTI